MITIVSGLPRSGTSLMMQMLEAAGLELVTDGVRGPDADNPKGYYELEAVKRIRRDDSFLVEAEGKVIKILAPLLRSLPSKYDYRIVFMERDLTEVLASQAAMLKRSGRVSDASADPALRAAFQDQVEAVKDWIEGQPNARALFVAHRNAIEDPMGVAATVLAYLDESESASRAGTERAPTSADAKRVAMARVVDKSLHHRA